METATYTVNAIVPQRRHGDASFSLLHKNVPDRFVWATSENFRIAIVTPGATP